MNLTTNIATLISIIGVLVALTNIIVEVIKKATWEKISTNVLAVVVSLALTLVAFFAWTSYAGIAVVWYYIVAAVIVGIMGDIAEADGGKLIDKTGKEWDAGLVKINDALGGGYELCHVEEKRARKKKGPDE